jgi:hypothetical protein
MTSDETDQIRRLIYELDRLVSRGGASVVIESCGEEQKGLRFVGNQKGYLVFGMELLKGGLLSPSEEPVRPRIVTVDVSQLVSDDSDVEFKEFVRNDGLEGELASFRITGWLYTLLLLVVAFLLIVGAFTVVRWVLELVA